MYAIVEVGGQQHRVAEGDRVTVLGLPEVPSGTEAEGRQVTITKVLAVGAGDQLTVGNPYVPNAKVIALVERELQGPKVEIFKFERRKKMRRRKGHRQQYVEIRVKSIEGGSAAPASGQPSPAEEKKGN